VRAHPPVTDSIQVNVSEFRGAPLSTHNVIEWGAPTTAYVLPMSTATLTPDFTVGPDFDIATHSFTWTTGGTNTRQPDVAIARGEFIREGAAAALFWNWEIVAAHGTATGIALPLLPVPEDRFNAVAGDLINVSQLTTAQVPGGYDAIRANALSVDSAAELVTGASGLIVVQESLGPQ
jgi:hypothetical protein